MAESPAGNGVTDAQTRIGAKISARAGLANLRANVLGGRDIDTVVERIYENLKTAGLTPSTLDPDGKKSDAEMTAEIDSLAKSSHLHSARESYKKLKSGEAMCEKRPEMASEIGRELKIAGVGHSSLDPQGKKTDGEMVVELGQLGTGCEPRKPRARDRNI